MKGRNTFGSGQNRLKCVGLLLLAHYKAASIEYQANSDNVGISNFYDYIILYLYPNNVTVYYKYALILAE